MYYVYLLRCADNSLYCGITTDLEKRVEDHNIRPTGAKYTRARRPVHLVYWEAAESKSEALRRELDIKSLKKEQKEKLVAEFRKSG